MTPDQSDDPHPGATPPVPGRGAQGTGLILARAYGLTGAEASVAMALADGASTAEIAVARQVSPHTVRNQIRVVLAKMEARHRGDVIRAVVRLTARL